MTVPALHIDDETRSAVDLKKTGVHVYAADETTDIWCAAYAFDDNPVDLWTPDDDLFCPPDIRDHVKSGGPIYAHNAAFERAIWRYILTPRYGWPEPKLEQWRCTMAMAYAMALPGALEYAAAALGLDAAKDMAGHGVMMRMARPRRRNADGSIVWWDDAERKQRLYAYCKQDVETERALHKRLVPLKASEQQLWFLDQLINDRGIHVDKTLCDAALKVVEQTTDRLDAEMRQVSDHQIGKCSNVGEIIAFCRARNIETDSIAKGVLEELLARDLPDDARRVLELRREAGKASVTKIRALLNGRSTDGRARGLLQFHAASTGRWAGRRFQPQNLKRPEMKDVDGAIQAVLTGSARAVELTCGAPLSVVGDCLRGMVTAGPGNTLYAADFSNIEGRGLAWLVGEQWKIEAFRAFDRGEGPDIYKKTAGEILGKHPSAIDDNERQGHGKVPELALGYQGGVGAFQTMAYTYGVKVTDAQADEIKVAWRDKHPRTRQFWYDVEDAAIRAVDSPGRIVNCGKVRFRVAGSFLFLLLPSGRCLCYPYPRIQKIDTPWGEPKDALTFKTVITPHNAAKVVDDASNTSKWARISTYGGSLTENIVQGLSRDVMAEGMERVERAGYRVVLTVHDEIVTERAAGEGSVDEFERLVGEVPKWAAGFPIAAAAWCGHRYRKG